MAKRKTVVRCNVCEMERFAPEQVYCVICGTEFDPRGCPVCSECHGPIWSRDQFCKNCGVMIESVEYCKAQHLENLPRKGSAYAEA